ncbi:MAG: M81 family metallopeptidase [Alphaproteobacteria bacterium]|nr:M81 family metallopeptidase [Alphaproteobacteria bacterium]
MRVFASSVKHETHSFASSRTDLTAFRNRDYVRDDDIPRRFRGTRTEWGAVFDAAGRLGWTVIHPLAVWATPSGLVTAGTFAHFSEIILSGLKAALPVDGVLLILHGAMIAEGADDPEGEILARVRTLVGPDLPVAITLDMHANVTDAMARHASIMTAYRTTPHIDMYETGWRAATILDRAMRGEVRPRVTLARRPMLGVDDGRTVAADAPMVQWLNLAAEVEAAIPGVLCASLQAGYAWGDIAEAGPSVAITADGYDARYVDAAERLIDEGWRRRQARTIDLLPLDQAMAIAWSFPAGNGPLLIADYTDCPAGGAPGDGTALLRAMVEAQLPGAVLGFLNDPAAVAMGRAAGVGATITTVLGGTLEPGFGGTPLSVTGRVATLSDGDYVRRGPMATGSPGSLGPCMLLKVGDLRIAVIGRAMAVDDREQFRTLGVHPEQERIVACKAMNHFRADFEPIGGKLIYVDSGGICSTDYRQFPYRKLRRPIAPLDFA